MQNENGRMQVQIARMQEELHNMFLGAGLMQSHNEHMDSALSAARSRILELESSTAWQMTGPLRRAGHRIKIMSARVHAMQAALKRIPRQADLAVSILK